MTPHDALAAGDLDAAIRLARESGGAASRLHLAELLGVAGEFREAGRVLLAVESADPGWPAARRDFALTLRAADRRRRARRARLPDFEVTHLRHRWRALRLQFGDPELAVRHVDRADRLAPDLAGHVDGREFFGLRDADDVFGSALELFAGGRWHWLPWESVARLRLEPAAGTLDLAFRRARITPVTGATIDAVLPLIYPHLGDTDDAFELGLETDFISENGGPVRGVGARLLRLGDDEVPLCEVRQLDIRLA